MIATTKLRTLFFRDEASCRTFRHNVAASSLRVDMSKTKHFSCKHQPLKTTALRSFEMSGVISQKNGALSHTAGRSSRLTLAIRQTMGYLKQGTLPQVGHTIGSNFYTIPFVSTEADIHQNSFHAS